MKSVEQWLYEQVRLGRGLYLVLDSDGALDARDALIAEVGHERYRAVYRSTPAHSLASAGPYLFQLDRAAPHLLAALLKAPEADWGWLATAPATELDALTQHWRDRLVVGEPPHQRLYRFHDNRVLGRALAHMPAEHHPSYLGPIASVCYWQAEQWNVHDNPAPGTHPVPPEPQWLNIPTPQATYTAVQFDNIRRYLMREHTDLLAALAEHQDIDTWLRTQLDLATTWNWQAPDALYFLLTQSLRAADYTLPTFWLPRPGETPEQHIERVRQEALYWQGSGPL